MNLKKLRQLIISLIYFVFNIMIRGYHKNIPVHTVLYYHGISDQEKVTFSKQLDDILRWAHIRDFKWSGAIKTRQT